MLSTIVKANRMLVPKFKGMASPQCVVPRLFSDDSHPDFQPKRANVPEGMGDVMKLIDEQVFGNDVMLFMKGTPSKPQCGFSGQVVRILNAIGVDFASVNVMEFPLIREGIKEYS